LNQKQAQHEQEKHWENSEFHRVGRVIELSTPSSWAIA
jgi:hypothetical protein